MSRARLLRLFWISAAAILIAAALVALSSVLTGSFDDTDGTILATLGTALLAGGAATAGAALYEARLSPAFGALVGLTAPVWFVLIAIALWHEFSGNVGKAAVTGYVVLAAELVVATARSLVGTRHRLLLLFGAAAACIGAGALVTAGAVWTEHGGSGIVKTAATLWILGGLGYLLIPVARRLAAAPASAAARAVDLARLAGRKPGETLYVVVEGSARFGDLELDAGEAAIARTAPELGADGRVVAVK